MKDFTESDIETLVSHHEKSELCDDCGAFRATTHYGMGAKRCGDCAAVFNEQVHRERQAAADAETARRAKHVCGDDDVCEECCDHDFDADEGNHCLSCGKDGSESVFSAAFERAKGSWKYGEA